MSWLSASMKKIRSKNEGARVLTRLYDVFFRRSRAANYEVRSGILPKFELIQAFIVVLVTCKNEKDPIKNEDFPHYNPMGAIRCHGNQSSNPIWPKT